MKRRILVTAGASGIGREFVRAFAALGDTLYTCDIDEKALETLAREIPGLLTKRCDMSERKDIEQMVVFGAEAMGGYDILINNAGIAGPTAPVEDINPDDWEKVMRVDLNGTFNTTRLVIPYLKKSAAGVIINMSSVAGRFGYAQRSPYATAKWGIIGFTKTLSIELGKYGIRANAILPGAVDGPRIQDVLKARAAANGTTIGQETENAFSVQSVRRFVDPKEIAALAVFLASDAAKSISGQLLPIDNDMQKAS